MKRIATSLIVLASLAGADYAFAQDAGQPAAVENSSENHRGGKRFNRGPVDLEQFSRMESLEAADTNGDGTLDRAEIEAHVLKQLVRRMSDRMERRLDIDGDGTVTLAEIEAQKAKEFAALDRNDDGKLDRSEMRAGKHGKSFGGRGDRGDRGGHHGMHRHR